MKLRNSIFKALLCGLFIVLTGIGTQWLVALTALGTKYNELVHNLFVGVCAGVFAYFVFERLRANSKRRSDEIAFLNHHIRNALVHLTPHASVQPTTALADATTRITRALVQLSEGDRVPLVMDNGDSLTDVRRKESR